MKRFGLFFGLLLLLFSQIRTRPLANPDEGRYASIGAEMLRTHEWIVPHLNGLLYFEKPPLGYWLISLGQWLFGHNLFGTRVCNAIATLLTCLLLYRFCKRFSSENIGFWAATFYGTALLPFGISQILTLDNFLTLFLTATLLSFASGFLEENEQRARKDFFWAYTWMALAVLTKGLIGIVLPALIGLPWLCVTKSLCRLHKAHLFKGLLCFFLLAAPWHFAVQHREPSFASFYFWHEHFERYLTNQHNRNQVWYFLPTAFVAGCLPWTFFLPRCLCHAWKNSTQNKKTRAIILFSFFWSGFILLFFSFSHSQLIPYILPAIAGIAISFAYGWAHVERSHLSCECSLWAFLFLLASMLALPLLQKRTLLPIPNSLLFILQILLFLGGMLGFWLAKAHPTASFRTLFTTQLLFYSLLPLFMTHFQRKMGKHICDVLLQQKIEKPLDVFCAYRYLDDFPFYLNQNVGTIRYVEEEHYFGWSKKGGYKLYLTTPSFQKRWVQHHPCYAVVEQSQRSRWECEMAAQSFYPLTEDAYFVLYKNKP